MSNSAIVRQYEVQSEAVQRWRMRWEANREQFATIEDKGTEHEHECEHELRLNELDDAIIAVLTDARRSGAPGKFSPEQQVKIIAVACEDPSDSGRPISHWTPQAIADEVVKRQIVESISPQSVGRFLK